MVHQVLEKNKTKNMKIIENSVNLRKMTWIRIHFFQCGSRIRIRIKIKWILSTENTRIPQIKILEIKRYFEKYKDKSYWINNTIQNECYGQNYLLLVTQQGGGAGPPWAPQNCFQASGFADEFSK